MKTTRPKLPREYGVAKSAKGLLPWSHVTERMASAKHYWICTVDPSGHPHATPVDGIWIDGSLYFGGSPKTRRQRNVAANPNICVHLESGMDVVILHGTALAERPARAMAARLAKLSNDKYGYGQTPEQYETSDVSVFRPRVAFAWTHLPKDATRWELP